MEQIKTLIKNKPKPTVIAIWLLYINFVLMVIDLILNNQIVIKHISLLHHQSIEHAASIFWLANLVVMTLYFSLFYKISKGSRKAEIALLVLIILGSFEVIFGHTHFQLAYPVIVLKYIKSSILIAALVLLHTKKSREWFASIKSIKFSKSMKSSHKDCQNGKMGFSEQVGSYWALTWRWFILFLAFAVPALALEIMIFGTWINHLKHIYGSNTIIVQHKPAFAVLSLLIPLLTIVVTLILSRIFSKKWLNSVSAGIKKKSKIGMIIILGGLITPLPLLSIFLIDLIFNAGFHPTMFIDLWMFFAAAFNLLCILLAIIAFFLKNCKNWQTALGFILNFIACITYVSIKNLIIIH